jgi:hypothetical protein
MRDRYLFSSDDQAKYCLLPSDEQKDTAQRMALPCRSHRS